MSLKSLKHYRIGDIVMTAKPLVYVVVDQMKGQLCDYCLGVKPSLMSCEECQQMFYCNQICQQNDWSNHRLECQIFANNPYMKSSSKIMIRLWLIINSSDSVATKSHALPNGQSLCLNELKVNITVDEDIVKLMDDSDDESLDESHDMSQSISIKDMAVLQFKALVNIFNECQLESELSQLWNLFLKVWSNVVKIDVIESESEDNAYGLYVGISALSHSCEPNACYVGYGTQLQVRAVKAIKPNDVIAISYIDFANPEPIRQQLLKSYFTSCQCLKCQINSDSNIDFNLFHELNHNFNQTLIGAKVDETVDRKQLLVIAEELVPYYESIYVDYYPEMSVFLVKYLQSMLLNVSQSKVDINKEFLDFVLQNVSITHGIDHKMYRKVAIVPNITLLDLETDADRVIGSLKSKPNNGLKKFILRAFLLFIIFSVFYNNFDLF